MNSLKEQLKNIKLAPDEVWKRQTRDFLLSKIKNQKAETAQSASWLTGWVGSLRAAKLAWQPVGIVAVVFMVVLGGSGAAVVASRQAVPGDKLFALKRAWEKVNEYMVTDAAHKTELASVVLGSRVNDLQKVLEQESRLVSADGANEANQTSIVVAVKEVNKQIDEVNDKFIALQDEDQESGQKVADAALDLNEKIRAYREEIKTAKQKVEGTQADKELDKVLARVEDINSEVLAVLVDKHNKGEATVEAGDLAMRVGEHVKQVETKLEAAADTVKIQEADGHKVELAAKVDEANETIKKANEALGKNEYSLALTLAKDSDKILEMIFGSIYETKNDEGEVKGAETQATSTEETAAGEEDSATSTAIVKKIISQPAGPTGEEKPVEYPVDILK